MRILTGTGEESARESGNETVYEGKKERKNRWGRSDQILGWLGGWREPGLFVVSGESSGTLS